MEARRIEPAYVLRTSAGLVRFAHCALARQNVPLARFVTLAMQAEFDSPQLTCMYKKAGPFLDLQDFSGGGAGVRAAVH